MFVTGHSARRMYAAIHPLEFRERTDKTTYILAFFFFFAVVTKLNLLFRSFHRFSWGFPGGLAIKNSLVLCRSHRRLGFDPWVRKISWRGAWQPTPVFLLSIGTWQTTVHRVAKSRTGPK